MSDPSEPPAPIRLPERVRQEIGLRAFLLGFTRGNQSSHIRITMMTELTLRATALGIEPEDVTMDIARALLAIIEAEQPWTMQ